MGLVVGLGYPAMYRLLASEGQLSEKCEGNTHSRHALVTVLSDRYLLC
jgi:hypothetical protein